MKNIKDKLVYERDICGFNGKANSIVFPDSIEEIKRIVKLSSLDIVPRGSGFNFVGGCVPDNSIIIDLSKMNKILDIDTNRKAVYLEAGVIIEDLNNNLEKYGLEFPVAPIFPGIQTVGGIIAVNAAGDREMKYGKISSWIDSLEVVDGQGNLLQVSKTDASDFVGLEGITGIIVRAKIRLTTKKTKTLSIFQSESFEELFEPSKKLKLDHEISMIEVFDKKLSILLGLENRYHLFIEYESNKGNIKEAFYDKFLKIKRSSYYILSSNNFTILENPRFFMDSLKEFILFLEKNNIPYSCNLGSYSVFACFKKSDAEKYERAVNLMKRLRAKMSYNLGIGLTKKQFLDKNEKDIIKRIKLRRDPGWKFNKNKIIDSESKNKEAGLQKEDISAGEPAEKIGKKSAEEKEIKQELQKNKINEKTPEQQMQEFVEEQKIEDAFSAIPVESAKINIFAAEKKEHGFTQEINEKNPEELDFKQKIFEAIDSNITIKEISKTDEERKKEIEEIEKITREILRRK